MKAVQQQVDLKLANLVICGVNKAGSTSLFSYLSDHPEISPSKVKETYFFRSVLYNEPLEDISQYGVFFDQEADERYRLEADPRYFYGKRPLAKSMKEHLSDDLQVIVLLRNPVRRFISFYKFKYFNLRPGVRDLTFDEFLNRCLDEYDERKDEPFVRNDYLYVRALKEGVYVDFLKDWVNEFGDKIQICFFDDMKTNPMQMMQQICRRLNIDSEFYTSYTFTHENKSIPPKNKKLHMMANRLNEKFDSFWLKQPFFKKTVRDIYYKFNKSRIRHIEVSDESLQRLQEFYASPNQELRAYLQEQGIVDLPVWLR